MKRGLSQWRPPVLTAMDRSGNVLRRTASRSSRPDNLVMPVSDHSPRCRPLLGRFEGLCQIRPSLRDRLLCAGQQTRHPQDTAELSHSERECIAFPHERLPAPVQGARGIDLKRALDNLLTRTNDSSVHPHKALTLPWT